MCFASFSLKIFMVSPILWLSRLSLILVLLGSSCSALRAQKGQSAPDAVVIQEKVVRRALRYADYGTAAAALHQLIALQGEGSTWRDTLLLVYTEAGNWDSAHLLADELREQRPEDNTLLAIDALALSQLGAAREAIAAYELLYSRTRKAAHGYELANLQHRIKRLAEAEATLAQILANDFQTDETAVFSTTTGGRQSVPLKAATLNLRGLVAYDMKQNEAALGYFRQALELQPDFAVAKQNEQTVQAATAAPAPKE